MYSASGPLSLLSVVIEHVGFCPPPSQFPNPLSPLYQGKTVRPHRSSITTVSSYPNPTPHAHMPQDETISQWRVVKVDSPVCLITCIASQRYNGYCENLATKSQPQLNR